MTTRQLDSDRIYRSSGQRIARLIHLYKARFRSKERARVQWLSQFFGSEGVILDIGAHFGYFSKEFSRLYNNSCSIYAFEPLTYNSGILKSVTANLPNIQVIKKAVSDTNGVVDINIPVKEKGKIGPGLAHFGAEDYRDYIVESVETVRLDDFVKDAAIPKVDFIKIDVEGAELLALRGGALTITQHKPVIFAEICSVFTQRLGYSPDELFAFLAESGYSASLVNGENLTMHPVTNYEECGDYLFIHKSKHVA